MTVPWVVILCPEKILKGMIILMKFTCDKSELQQAVNICSRAVAAKSPLPALEGILINAGEALRLTGYDLKEGIYTELDAEIEEYGSIVIGARFLSEMLRRMPDGRVSLTTDEELNVYVVCGKNEYKFVGLSTEDYPEMPEIKAVNSIKLPMPILKSMIVQTIFAVADTDIRPIYTGALFDIREDILHIVAVDGYRLAKRTESFTDRNMENCSFVVPGDALSDIERICSDDNEKEVMISVGDKHISFTIDNTVVLTRRLEGEFMNYEKSLPTEFDRIITVSRAELLSSIDRVSLIISEKNNCPVRMKFDDDRIQLSCLNPVGKAEDVCFCEGDGRGMEIGFNNRYMTEALKAAGVEKIKLCLISPTRPCVIKAEDESDKFTYMILPVRLKN